MFPLRTEACDLIPPCGIEEDITEGKNTLVLLMALKRLGTARKARLVEIISLHTSSKKLVKEAFDLIVDCGAKDEAIGFAKKLLSDSWNELETKEGKRCDLKNLEKFVLNLGNRQN